MHASQTWSPPFEAQERAGFAELFWPFVLFVLAATSSLVQNEPAPYDFLLMFSMVLYALSAPRLPTGLAWPALGVFMLLFGYTVGAMFAIRYTEAFLYLRTSTYLSVSLLFYGAIIWRAPQRIIPPMMAGLVITSLIAASLGIAGYFDVIPSETYALFGRATGPFKDPNVFAPSLIFPTLYLAHRLATRPAVEMLWSLPAFLVLMMGLFLSFSRGAWINFAIAAMVFLPLTYGVSEPRQRARLLGFTLLLAVIGAIAIAVALSIDEVRSLFLQRFQLVQEYDAAEGGRFDSMRGALWMALTYPLGIGPEQWPHVSALHLMPHNIYVNVFVSGGVISLIGFVGLTWMTIRTGYRAVKLNPAYSGVLIVALGTFIGHAVEGVIIDSNHWRHLYIVMGLVWGLALAAQANAGRNHRATLR